MPALGTPLRIGLTMRRSDAQGYVEPRDALARDWTTFMTKVLPEACWMPIPNVGTKASDYARRWGLDGFIFTGGDTPGDDPLRDATELALLQLAQRQDLPVFGVCRGLQIMATANGDGLEKSDDTHAGTTHEVTSTDSSGDLWPAQSFTVNSFHRMVLPATRLDKQFLPLALDKDGNVEAIRHSSHPLAAILWHPERPSPSHPFDRALIRTHFGLNPMENQ